MGPVRAPGAAAGGGGFPAGFLWGAATSAYQIEGSPLADGAGPSIWHRFSHTPGRTRNGETGDVACDHYRRWREDVALLRDLGLTSYRFSLAWGRLLPEGIGRVNRAGVDFYSRLIDALLEHGIQPCVTLYHWDLPAALDDRGGWLNPDIVGAFAEYAQLAFESFDDRVPLWATLNEPWVVVDGGYLYGVHAPGHRSLFEAPRAAHHLLLAHAAAVRCYREAGSHRIGLVVNLEPKDPASDRDEDVAAALRADAYMNRFYLDPVFGRGYPQELPAMFGEAWPAPPDSEIARIAEPLDFVGVNYYKRGVTCHDDSDPPVRARLVRVPGAVETELGWEVHPAGLTRTLAWVRNRYGSVPLYVTENGAAFPDPPVASADVVEDPLRVDYLRAHLAAAREAIAGGVNLRGYFVWSLLDNYEWAHGTSKRFGIVHVDHATQKRTWKRSAHVYREIIRANGAAPAAGPFAVDTFRQPANMNRTGAAGPIRRRPR
jgi:beta-glucosidase